MNHIAYQRIGRDDAEPQYDEEGGLEPCTECDGDGCLLCDDKGYFYGEEPMSKSEYDKFIEDMRYPT